MKVGFDIGSKTIKSVVIDNGKIIDSNYILHDGDIKQSFINTFNLILSKYSKSIESFGICGNVSLNGIKVIDNIVANVVANKFLNTKCRNILSVGFETFSLMILDEELNYIEHSSNPLCASGTGSFLDQQAERIGLSTEELAEVAYSFNGKTPKIATRCAVFAKSDIIHSQAEGYSKEAIATGLCEGLASSIIANLLKGRELKGDVLFIGGLSKNRKIVLEVQKLLNRKVVTSNDSLFFGAIGAALLGNETDLNIENLSETFSIHRQKRDKMIIKQNNYPDFKEDKTYYEDNIEVTEYAPLDKDLYDIYLGIDIGSTSTKAIIITNDNEILLGLYTKTAGEPVAATQNILRIIKKIFKSKRLNILGVGTTGSGRKLVKEIFNADIDVNEISTHAKAAVFLDKDVDTIIEIGGQDSKYTLLHKGNVVNSTMNYVCAAGTGSFIEEQAKRLNITLDDISKLATEQVAPYTSDRCTVYMERDLNIFLSEGFTKEEIITSVLYSVRDNYLSKVVGKSPIGNKVFFQGATARNRALVSVFEMELGKEIFVSKYCHLTGALGSALYSKELSLKESSFRFTDFNYTKENEICTLCHNNCELSIYTVDDVKTCWGLKCGREYSSKKAKSVSKNSDLSKKYKDLFEVKNEISQIKKRVGYPMTVDLIKFHPLFKDFFEKLGFEFVAEFGDKKTIQSGIKLINSDFCAPIIMLHGLVESLSQKCDYVFIPSIINEKNLLLESKEEEKYLDKFTDSYFCYYSQYAPVIIDKLTTFNLKDKLITPKIKFNNTKIESVSLILADLLSDKLGVSKESVTEQFLLAYANWNNNKLQWKNNGDEILNKTGKKIMFLGRPYSFFDNYLNNGIPKKFESMGFDILYQDMIDFKGERLYSKQYLDRMHWFFGQEILLASEFIAARDDIYPVFLTYFRCSPDSYLMSYFKDIMNKANKPYLIIQLDEHSSDVGYQTRIEAFVDTIKNDRIKPKIDIKSNEFVSSPIENSMTVLIPYLSSVISELQSSLFEAYGYKSILLPLEEKMTNEGFKYCSGGECLPNASIIGSIIETMKSRNLKDSDTIVFMPTVCMGCNFTQYAILIKLALSNAGYPDIKIANSNTLKQLDELPKELNVNLTEVNILGSILLKLLFRVRPYERKKGEADEKFNYSMNLIKKNLNERKSLMETARQIKEIFEKIELFDIQRKPKVAILGDLYAKYNNVLNNNIYELIEDLGGEVVIPSFTETVSHFLHIDIKENNLESKYLRGLVIFEKRYERIFETLLKDNFEPDLEECFNYMKEYGIKHYIAGETSINLGRMLYYAKNKLVAAAVHLNPVFCCPGVVTASIFRKIQNDFNIPIIDIFYDGNNKPNNVIIPHLYFLNLLKNSNLF